MLILKRITLENFGPYKGTQAITLDESAGVTVVYGENMRGKTTLLNAIRYAFFGYVTGRGEHQVDLAKVGNWEAADEGKYGFKVILDFLFKGEPFELTRECTLRAGVAKPKYSTDYEETRFLRRGTTVLGPEERDLLLAEVLPETVSRFFLFDGELLQQYEELLREDSEMGLIIKASIERILGLPVLTNGRADMTEATSDAQRLEAKAAQKEQKTQELGNQHQQLLERRHHQTQELKKLVSDREQLAKRKTVTEDHMRGTVRLNRLLSERDALQESVADIEKKIEEKRARARELMTDSWRWLLAPRIKQLSHKLADEMSALQDVVTQQAVLARGVAAVERALEMDKCDSCLRTLDAASKTALSSKLADLRAEMRPGESDEALAQLVRRRSALEAIVASDKSDTLSTLLSDIDDLRVDRTVKLDRIGEVKELTKELDESDIRKVQIEHDKIVQEIALLDQGIREQLLAVTELEDSIRRVQGQLDKVGGSAFARERLKREMCESLQHLFEAAVDEYRERLRKKVEADATAIFLQLTTEADYAKLGINPQYGLTIQHKDGSDIPVRSAGAEHIVALSLMGALQRNAPLRGPIIMDSPFGRLDDSHTTRVVRALPSMADQVVLLVYEAEMEPSLAREQLKGKLRREYRLVRRSARHTEIAPFTE